MFELTNYPLYGVCVDAALTMLPDPTRAYVGQVFSAIASNKSVPLKGYLINREGLQKETQACHEMLRLSLEYQQARYGFDEYDIQEFIKSTSELVVRNYNDVVKSTANHVFGPLGEKRDLTPLDPHISDLKGFISPPNLHLEFEHEGHMISNPMLRIDLAWGVSVGGAIFRKGSRYETSRQFRRFNVIPPYILFMGDLDHRNPNDNGVKCIWYFPSVALRDACFAALARYPVTINSSI